MTEGALEAPAPFEGATNRLWRRIRGPVDLVYVDPGASGEVLAARARVPIAFLLILIHLLPGWPSGPDLAVLLLAIAVLGYALLVRRLAASHYTTPMGYATSVIDVTAVTASLALMGLSDPVSPLRSIVRFDLYFLAISTSSLKMNWRVCAVASGLAFIQYAGVLAAVAAAAETRPDWAIQAGRLGALLGAGYLSVVVVLRAQQLRDLSTRDFLTGLANRAVLDSRLAEELSRASRHRRRFSLALVDVDHFKRFNDAYGHAAGDEVLRGLAEVLKTSVRESDLVARYGGEEFAVLLPEARVGEACAKLEALRLLVEATPFSEGGEGLCHKVTLSAGVAEFPADGASVAELLATADGRLYQAKHAGRNRVEAGLASRKPGLPRA